MARYAWGNAKTEDLWNVLSEVSGVGVSKIMSIWTKQAGYPLISLSLKDCVLEFEQVFILNESHEYWCVFISDKTNLY